MVVKSGYVALALKLHEAALAAETEDGPWKTFLEAGARHSASDMGHLQAIHDASMVLGATCGGGAVEESAKPVGGTIKLVESAEFAEAIEVREGAAVRTSYPIRVISPGTGSMAHYPADMLKREAGKFKPGTLMFWNHPTRAEEAARPEGNLDNLAAILTSAGRWEDNGPKGPGVYAEAKVMSDYAEKVAERAPHIGVSIRGGGLQEGAKVVDGKPVLKGFDFIESVDYVTKAGRGGLALAEAARDAGLLPPIQIQEAAGMTAEETKKLIEAAVAPYQTRLLRSDAREEAKALLESVALPQIAKNRIIERATATVPTTADGAIDVTKLREAIVAEAKAEGEYLAQITGGGQVRGMGIAAPEPENPEARAVRETAEKQEFEDRIAIYESMGMPTEAAKLAAKGRAA